MKDKTGHYPSKRVTDLVELKKWGSKVSCDLTFEVLPVDFTHTDNQFQAFIFLCRLVANVDGEAFVFRKCYARGCPHNLCPHVSQAVIIVNRYLQRDYSKLRGVGIEIEEPPLRSRKEDIPVLVDHFISNLNRKTGKSIKGVSNSAMRILMDYNWKGNVRELENAMEHGFVLCDREMIEVADFPLEICLPDYSSPAADTPSGAPVKPSPRKKLTKEELQELLNQYEWNKSAVGRQLHLSYSAIWKYMKK